MSTSRRGPLHGMRVVDFSQLIAGPSAGAMLGDLGADVIKVERLEGEVSRSLGGGGVHPAFTAYNRGKRSIAMDLSSAEGTGVAQQLIRASDVLLEGFRPGVMDRLGLGYEAARAINPRLVYASLSAFGSNADNARRPGLDSVVQAESGVMALTGAPDAPPTKVGFQVVDAAAGLALGQAILAALLHRERSGEGSHVAVSLFEVAAFLQSPAFVLASRKQAPLTRQGNTSGDIGAPSGTFETQDGKFLMISAYLPQQWRSLCELLEMTELLEDPRFVTNAERLAHHDVLSKFLAERFLTRSRDAWDELLRGAGIISGSVRTHDEILADDDLRATGRFCRVVASPDDSYWLPEMPFTSSSWEAGAGGLPPAVGDSTRSILLELGATPEAVEALLQSGAVSATD